MKNKQPGKEMDERPPIMGSWRNIYIFILGTLLLLIGLFSLFTIAYK